MFNPSTLNTTFSMISGAFVCSRNLQEKQQGEEQKREDRVGEDKEEQQGEEQRREDRVGKGKVK